MRLSDLHQFCVDLQFDMDGELAEVLRGAIGETAPAAALDRHQSGAELNTLISAFGKLREALVLVGLALREDGMYAATWTPVGWRPIGSC